MSSTIVQLREKDNLDKTSDNSVSGKFTCHFDKPIVVEQGDQLAIKSVYLDTRATDDQEIEIDDSCDEFNINHILYLNNHLSGGTYDADFAFFQDDSKPVIAQPNSKKYFVGQLHDVTAVGDLKNLTSTFLFASDADPHGNPPIPSAQGSLDGKTSGGVLNFWYYAFDANAPARTATDPRPPNWPSAIATADIYPCPAKYKPTLINLYAPAVGSGGNINFQLLSKKGTQDYVLNIHFLEDPRTQDNLHLYGPTSKEDPNVNDWVSENLNWEVGDFVTQDDTSPVEGNGLFRATEFNVAFPIEHGKYTPDGLAKYITDRLSNIKMTSTGVGGNFNSNLSGGDFGIQTFPTKNAYFTSCEQVRNDSDFGMNNVENYYIAEDGQSVLSIDKPPSANYVIGASQMALIFDPSFSKFIFQQIHSPILDGNGSSIIEYVQQAQTGVYNVAPQHSGVVFTHNMSQKMNTLLFQKMGFDGSMLVDTSSGALPRIASMNSGGLLNMLLYDLNIIEGVNATGGLSSIDTAYKKGFTYPVVPSFGDLASVSTVLLNSIMGSAITIGDVGSVANAYFQIEITGLPNTNVINNGLGKVQAIIGRYYATSDFTESQQATGSIPYIHSGSPFYISSLNIRVLDPDGGISNSISNDNTIFLEILKAQKK